MTRTTYSVAIALSIVTYFSINLTSLRGAELRQTLGDREVVRQISYTEDVVPQDSPGVVSADYGPAIGCDSCGGGCNSCDSCGSAGYGYAGQPSCLPRAYAHAEYLLWWRSGNRAPALVTTSPVGTAQAVAGELSNSTVVFGNETFGNDAQPGGRITLGWWLDQCQCWGVMTRFYALDDATSEFSADQSDFPIIGRPFFNTGLVPPAEDANLVAFNDGTTQTRNGRVDAYNTSDFVGGDILFRRKFLRCRGYMIEFLTGYQYNRLDDELQISTFSQDQPTNFPAASVVDNFRTKNEYHAFVLGLMGHTRRGCWDVEFIGKVALGTVDQTVTIAGETTTFAAANNSNTVDSGLLAQRLTNAGTFQRDEFMAVPELSVNFHYDMNCRWRATVGFNAMYFSSILEAANQVDTVIDGRLLNSPNGPLNPPATNPALTFNESDVWVYGLNFGLLHRF